MLKSLSKKPVTYVGYTKDLKKRIQLHNAGKGAKFTRGRTWKLIYKEVLKSKSKAISREYYIKNNKSLRKKIKEENK
jgi:putative endonuclease